MPKWDKKEAELQEKGIIPEPIREEWELRARNWFLAQGCVYDMKIGNLVQKTDNVKIPRARWLQVTEEIKAGRLKFVPDRENDELTLALGNPEHVGRVRALRGGTTMKEAWPECADTYRSRSRKKKQELDRLSALELQVKRQQQLGKITRLLVERSCEGGVNEFR